MSQPHPKIPSLDGIRALAVLLVITAHAGFEKVVPGGFGVTVFFFLSGYLIATLLSGEEKTHGSINLPAFYYRRALRILPPFIIVYAACTAIATFSNELRPAKAILFQLAMLTNYQVLLNGEDSIIPSTLPYWSLSVEEHYYALFPILLITSKLFRADRKSFALRILLPLCIMAPFWRYYIYTGMENSAAWNYYASDTRYDSILWGAFFALYRPHSASSEKRSLEPRTVAIAILCLSALIFTFIYRDPLFRETVRYTLQAVALYPLFKIAIEHSDTPIISWLNKKPLTTLGVYSYSMYLVHTPIINVLREIQALPSSPAATLIIALPITILFSHILYKTVELPAAKLKHKLFRRQREIA